MYGKERKKKRTNEVTEPLTTTEQTKEESYITKKKIMRKLKLIMSHSDCVSVRISFSGEKFPFSVSVTILQLCDQIDSMAFD